MQKIMSLAAVVLVFGSPAGAQNYEFEFKVNNGTIEFTDGLAQQTPSTFTFHAGTNVSMTIGLGPSVIQGSAPHLTFGDNFPIAIPFCEITSGQKNAYFQFEDAVLEFDPVTGTITNGTVKVDVSGRTDQLAGRWTILDFRSTRLIDGNSPGFDLSDGLGVGSGMFIIDFYLIHETSTVVTVTNVLVGETIRSGSFTEPDTRPDPGKVKIPWPEPERELIAKHPILAARFAELEDRLERAADERDALRRRGVVIIIGAAAVSLAFGILMGMAMAQRKPGAPGNGRPDRAVDHR